MTDNTKQSEETYIRWSVNMNSAIEVGQIEPEPILTIHPDGRVTTSPRLKPDEISALVLDQIKTAWLKDAQATKIRELQEYVTQLENRLRALWDKYDVDSKHYHEKIYRLDEAGNNLARFCVDGFDIDRWNQAKEAKP